MYMAMTVAKYIVSKCTRNNTPIYNLQLQKLLYLIQKEALAHKIQYEFVVMAEIPSFGRVACRMFVCRL